MDSTARFPFECFNEICRHLRGNDLLQCTLVCPEWNNFIGSTKSCMEKIILRCVNHYDKLKRMKRSLKNSRRQYKRINVEGEYFEGVKKILLMNGRTWTHINCSSMQLASLFETMNHCLDFLKIFQSSVQTLGLGRTKTAEPCEILWDTQQLQFP